MGCTWSDGPYYNGNEYRDVERSQSITNDEVKELQKQVKALIKRVDNLEKKILAMTETKS